MINRNHFFTKYHDKYGATNNSQTDGLIFLLNKLDESKVFNLASEYADILSQIKRETNDTFQPIQEGYWIKSNRLKKLYNYYASHNPHALDTIFPNGIDGLNYLGRGRIQTTHNFNYEKIGDRIGIDLINNPDLLLDNEVDWKVLELGFSEGIWTGKKLSDYVNDNIIDYYNSRKIVNGLDSAREISDNAKAIYNMIEFI